MGELLSGEGATVTASEFISPVGEILTVFLKHVTCCSFGYLLDCVISVRLNAATRRSVKGVGWTGAAFLNRFSSACVSPPYGRGHAVGHRLSIF